jgi:hypothetical protein
MLASADCSAGRITNCGLDAMKSPAHKGKALSCYKTLQQLLQGISMLLQICTNHGHAQYRTGRTFLSDSLHLHQRLRRPKQNRRKRNRRSMRQQKKKYLTLKKENVSL